MKKDYFEQIFYVEEDKIVDVINKLNDFDFVGIEVVETPVGKGIKVYGEMSYKDWNKIKEIVKG